MKNFLIIFNLFFILLASCASKNKETILTNSELLVQSIWTETHDFEKINGTYTEFGDACFKDDTREFKSDGEVIVNYGPLLCEPDEPAPAPIVFGWRLEENDSILVFEFPFDEVKYVIVSINDSELVLDELDPGTNTPTVHRVILRR